MSTKTRDAAAQHDGVCRRRKRVRWHDYLVARLEVEMNRSESNAAEHE
jgi:hypothetical protein